MDGIICKMSTKDVLWNDRNIKKNFSFKKKKESIFSIEIIKSELGHEGKALIQRLVSFILLLFWKIFIYLVAPGLSCHTQGLQLQRVGSSSLIRGQIQAPCIGILKSSPLVHQGSPWCHLKKRKFGDRYRYTRRM